MTEFLHFLQGRMDTPTWFGWFHWLWIIWTVVACTLICIFRKKMSRKLINYIILFTGIALILFEIYKQIVFSFNYNGGNPTWSFHWYAFPFQFCSTPMYLMLIAGILRKGKVYDSLLCYLATFAFFGGLCVMIYTGGVFISMIGINIQTMFWHSSMVIIGFMLLVTKSIDLNFKSILKATLVFLAMIILAMIMNIIWHYYGTDETFNMFYISPYYPCPLVILDKIYLNTPYAVFLMIYIVGFVLAASIVMLVAMLIDKLITTNSQRKMFPDEKSTENIIKLIKKDF